MKSKIFIGIFLVIIMIANISLASYSTVTMEVVKEPVCTIEIGENSKFEKRLISKDLANKEVTLQLKVTNEEKVLQPTGEVILVIDNSNSMKETTSSNVARSDLVKASAKTFVTKLLKDNDNLKIGAVSFSSSAEKNQEGYVTLGTTKDATLLSQLTSDVSTLTKAIDNITYVDDTVASYTDLQAGLNMGKQLFSKNDTNKYLIILTDGIPNVILNKNEVTYNEDVISATKKEYDSIVSSGIEVITLLSGIEDDTATIPNTEYTYGEYIEKLFGTSNKPNFGTFYYVTDSEIEQTITNEIYNSLVPKSKALENIKIVDYFPKEIIDNFDFSYVSKASIGTISATVDKTNNSITWTIPKLDVGETATVEYKLKLKENFDSSIVNKILDTNKKVDLTYTDTNDKTESKTSDITPQLKLLEPPPVLPQTGTIAFIGFVMLSIVLVIFSSIKLVNFYKETH